MTDGPISDPKALRALSHPFRWKLINQLTEEGPRTATQCAASLGESVASCSYHLNMLAKYGFVAEVEGPGRQKPWKIISRHQSISSEGLEGEAAMAAETAVLAYLDHEFERTRARLRQHDRLPEEWRNEASGIGFSATTKFLTVEETGELQRELHELFNRYSERTHNPELRPEGARPVRYFLSTTVSPD